MESINSFTLENSFLNNDHICLVHSDGLLFPSVTHAFQAARSETQEIKEKISKIHDFESMYEIAETIEDPPRWSKTRGKIMEILIRDKFRRNPVLRQRLSETGTILLTNSYDSAENPNNLFWGVVNGRGENFIGKILMKIRSDIANDTELENWLLLTFELVKEKSEIPQIILHVYRNEKRLKKLYLEDKPFYTIGSALDCDLKFSHNSIDSYHAVIAHDKSLGVVLIDLNSSSGTFIEGNRVKKSIPAPLYQNDTVLFGEKQKVYKIEIDYEYVQRECEKKISDVDKELKMLELLQNPSKDPESIKESLGLVKIPKVHVENITRKNCNEKDLKELFASLGEIVNIDIPRRSSGYEAFVTFKSYESADNATKWNGMSFNGKRLSISIYKRKNRSRSRSFS